MDTRHVTSLIAGLFLAFIACCDGGKMADQPIGFSRIKDVPNSAWRNLSEKKIYFGHQSVGNNIIEGIEILKKENPQIKLNLLKTNALNEINTGTMAHSSVGRNREPETKIEDFRNLVEKVGSKNVNIAFFKFCYVDIGGNTDVEKLFISYKNAMAKLRQSFPGITFVHVTSPLTTLESGPKAYIKRLIGRPVFDYEDNMKRHAYNEMIRTEYSGKEPIFDLALIEATFPNGRKNVFVKDGKAYPYLVPEYTKDRGHLDENGRKIVAEQLLMFLASL